MGIAFEAPLALLLLIPALALTVGLYLSARRRVGVGRRRTALVVRTLLLTALVALKKGDFSARLPDHFTGIDGKIADTFNDVIELNQRMAAELERLSRVVGKEGKISQRASIGQVSGAWATQVASVNAVIICTHCDINRRWRRLRRSAITPPISVNSRIGISPTNESSPRKNADAVPVSVTMSQAWAAF